MASRTAKASNSSKAFANFSRFLSVCLCMCMSVCVSARLISTCNVLCCNVRWCCVSFQSAREFKGKLTMLSGGPLEFKVFCAIAKTNTVGVCLV